MDVTEVTPELQCSICREQMVPVDCVEKCVGCERAPSKWHFQCGTPGCPGKGRVVHVVLRAGLDGQESGEV
jgi:hypothetical protein